MTDITTLHGMLEGEKFRRNVPCMVDIAGLQLHLYYLAALQYG